MGDAGQSGFLQEESVASATLVSRQDDELLHKLSDQLICNLRVEDSDSLGDSLGSSRSNLIC